MAGLPFIGGTLNDKQTWTEIQTPLETTGGFSPIQTPPENNNPEFTSQPLTANILIGALFDSEQLQYDQGTLLFAFKDPSIKNQYIPVFGLQNMNYDLEMRKRVESVPKSKLDESSAIQKKQRINLERYLMFPLNVKEFMDRICFLGVFNSKIDSGNSKTIKASYIHKGRARIANIFKDHEGGQSLSVGDTVFLIVKQKFNTEPGSLLGYDGKSQGKGTPGTFLQIEGAWEPKGSNLILSTDFYRPKKRDADIGPDDVEPTQIQQIEYPTDPKTGLTLFNQPPKTSAPISVNLYEGGYPIRLGVVQRLTQKSTPQDVDAATRTFAAYRNLMTYSSIDVELTPQTYSSALF